MSYHDGYEDKSKFWTCELCKHTGPLVGVSLIGRRLCLGSCGGLCPNPDVKATGVINSVAWEEQADQLREFPRGKLNQHDEGQTQLALFIDKGTTIIMNFTKPIKWLGFSAADARMIGKRLIELADQIES